MKRARRRASIAVMGMVGGALCGPSVSYAQVGATDWEAVHSRDFVMIGYQSIDMDAVNVRMAGAGLPDFSPSI